VIVPRADIGIAAKPQLLMIAGAIMFLCAGGRIAAAGAIVFLAGVILVCSRWIRGGRSD
jgi:hypothetical protein